MRALAVLVAAAALVAACAATKKPVVPADQLWKEGNQAFQDEAWELAVERYKALLDQHPFDANAEEAELKIAQAHYLAHRYAEAIAAFGDFERMHPTSPNLALVEYHLGMSYLEQSSTSDRDQQSATNALTYFRNLTDRFPTSPWAEKARLRVRECRESLARHETDVAAWYLRHRNLLAAEARLRGLLREYPETDATAEALHTFAEFYAGRNEKDEVRLALATLARHHPDGPLAAEARERLGRTTDDVDGPDPLPLLVARLEAMASQSDRQNVPVVVSAYPNQPPTTKPALSPY
ncbi:MAG TPA: outer membrane protein assembly factor BamD [Candidatus Binatia bacterium]|nr:outer membrane protein assembly factor BamD [Candidatus Binatia bacterium]